MKTFLFFLSLFTAYCSLFTNYCLAQSNIFGLHLTQTSDVDLVAPIINSSGGDWGYVTIVIRTDQLDQNAWQEFFDKCRQHHLIPLLRLANLMDQNSWKRPSTSDIDNLANFLNRLNWPSNPRHIILFNEINHGSEWGGDVDIKNYVDTAIYASQKFKQLDNNFYIITGGLDLAAPEKPPQFKSAENVYREIVAYKPDFFNQIDGISSHSYPNHGYVGKPTDSGQHSIRGYLWELQLLKQLGINKNLSVFITETGWPHREGESPNNNYYTADTSAKFLISALNFWGQDNRVIAVTPFIFNYPYSPFDHFSWLNKNQTLYPAYQSIINLSKTQNHPSQTTSYEFVSIRLPIIIAADTTNYGEITLKNTGQSIWGEAKFCLKPFASPEIAVDALCLGDQKILPGQKTTLAFKFSLPENKAKNRLTYFIGWENLPTTDILAFSSKSYISTPKDSFFEKVLRLFKRR